MTCVSHPACTQHGLNPLWQGLWASFGQVDLWRTCAAGRSNCHLLTPPTTPVLPCQAPCVLRGAGLRIQGALRGAVHGRTARRRRAAGDGRGRPAAAARGARRPHGAAQQPGAVRAAARVRHRRPGGPVAEPGTLWSLEASCRMSARMSNLWHYDAGAWSCVAALGPRVLPRGALLPN